MLWGGCSEIKIEGEARKSDSVCTPAGENPTVGTLLHLSLNSDARYKSALEYDASFRVMESAEEGRRASPKIKDGLQKNSPT